MNPDINVTVTLPAPIQVSVSQPPAIALSASNIGGPKGDRGVDGISGTNGQDGPSDHTLLSNIGTNTHAQIDTALSRLSATSGTNTGDQDLSSYATTSSVNTGLATKANTAHSHAIADVSDLQTQLTAATTVKRQNNTTNSTVTATRIETGWGVFAQGAAANKSEAVTFQTAFTSIPIVTISYGGDQTGGTIALGNGGNTEKGPVAIKAYGETTSGFTAHAHTTDGTSWSATANVYYKWTAIGS